MADSEAPRLKQGNATRYKGRIAATTLSARQFGSRTEEERSLTTASEWWLQRDLNPRFGLERAVSRGETYARKYARDHPSKAQNQPPPAKDRKKNPSASPRLTEGRRSARLLDRPVW